MIIDDGSNTRFYRHFMKSAMVWAVVRESTVVYPECIRNAVSVFEAARCAQNLHVSFVGRSPFAKMESTFPNI